ncbi:peptidoglycan-binding domain-containing protein [Streptomyces hiroshimensis]|uniref:Peptidoglycan binding-like domain-containing protein n=1 Tax=Streptomyces hiroshimensis TaxID=66424 RepID=A0ABQ2ZB01_9ACTN|nr:peptidoglycan-binding domain-containing protein [Streptomyces hiroshimensis]GGY08060.1 hypothetical protein GCM10010324_63750 [Streptomyces hiroshimensis]
MSRSHGSRITDAVDVDAAAPAASVTGNVSTSTPLTCGFYDGNSVVIKFGSSGEAVKEAQCILVKRDYDIGPFGIDGQYGQDTQAAVRAFQDHYNRLCKGRLAVDGEVGPKTWPALRAWC